jgi:hypothetical protein
MEIKIEKNGSLELGGIKKYCPDQRPFRCGDWCARFGEPEYGQEFIGPGQAKRDCLAICQGRILSGEVIDKRVKP